MTEQTTRMLEDLSRKTSYKHANSYSVVCYQ